jgi:Xaa-Pro dipeptidase
LPSLKNKPRPFTDPERQARIEKAHSLMGNHGLDAIVLAGGTSSEYFSNLQIGGGERL